MEQVRLIGRIVVNCLTHPNDNDAQSITITVPVRRRPVPFKSVTPMISVKSAVIVGGLKAKMSTTNILDRK